MASRSCKVLRSLDCGAGTPGGRPLRSNQVSNFVVVRSATAPSCPLHVKLATLNEDLGQPFGFADHEVVAGVKFDERVHPAEGVDAPALRLNRECGRGPSDPSMRHVGGQGAAVNLLQHDRW